MRSHKSNPLKFEPIGPISQDAYNSNNRNLIKWYNKMMGLVYEYGTPQENRWGDVVYSPQPYMDYLELIKAAYIEDPDEWFNLPYMQKQRIQDMAREIEEVYRPKEMPAQVFNETPGPFGQQGFDDPFQLVTNPDQVQGSNIDLIAKHIAQAIMTTVYDKVSGIQVANQAYGNESVLYPYFQQISGSGIFPSNNIDNVIAEFVDDSGIERIMHYIDPGNYKFVYSPQSYKAPSYKKGLHPKKNVLTYRPMRSVLAARQRNARRYRRVRKEFDERIWDNHGVASARPMGAQIRQTPEGKSIVINETPFGEGDLYRGMDYPEDASAIRKNKRIRLRTRSHSYKTRNLPKSRKTTGGFSLQGCTSFQFRPAKASYVLANRKEGAVDYEVEIQAAIDTAQSEGYELNAESIIRIISDEREVNGQERLENLPEYQDWLAAAVEMLDRQEPEKSEEAPGSKSDEAERESSSEPEIVNVNELVNEGGSFIDYLVEELGDMTEDELEDFFAGDLLGQEIEQYVSDNLNALNEKYNPSGVIGTEQDIAGMVTSALANVTSSEDGRSAILQLIKDYQSQAKSIRHMDPNLHILHRKRWSKL